jgi:hypothetical protein
VTVGDAGRILVSSDAATWTPARSTVNETLRGVVYGGNQFVAVGDNGRVLISPDGNVWTAETAGISDQLNAVCYANSLYVAVGENGAIVTSSDAQTWHRASSGVSTSLRGASAVTGIFDFLVCGAGGVILTSPDGAAWTARASGTTTDLAAVSQNLFVGPNDQAFFFGITQTGSSTTWSATNTAGPATGDWRGAAAVTEFRLVVGDGGQVAGGAGLLRNYVSGTTEDLKAVTFAQNCFVAVGADETILQGANNLAGFAAAIGNLSARSLVSPDHGPLVGGFVIAGAGTKGLLIRASGPALAAFGISAPLATPILTVYDATGKIIAQNAGWSDSADAGAIRSTAVQVGAFAFASGSADSAVVIRLPPGSYTANVTGQSSGISLLELYDTDLWPIVSTSRLVNLSSLCYVGSGESAAVTGMTVPIGRSLLLRAVGPTLAQFGVPNLLQNPRIDLIRPPYTSSPVSGSIYYPARDVANNAGWNDTVSPILDGLSAFGSADQIRAAALLCGAFPLPEGSHDSAMLVSLNLQMTIQISSVDGRTGTALVEVYDTGT